MPHELIYIDDDNVGEYCKSLNSACPGEINVTEEKPLQFDQIRELFNTKNYAGVILDLNLDKTPTGELIDFKANTVAQWIRDKGVREPNFDIPIFLFSSDDNLKASYYKEHTAQVLYDEVYEKHTRLESDIENVGKELLDIINGYNQIKSAKNANPKSIKNLYSNILNCSIDFLDSLDSRFIPSEHLNLEETNLPSFEFADFILHEVIWHPGILIDEKLLAARLGVDIELSADWEVLRNKMSDLFGYQGIFGKAWPRWWAKELVSFWYETFNEHLRSVPADERIKKLQEKFRLTKLKSAEPMSTRGWPEKYKSTFWTICEFSKKPLDPTDGFLVNEKTLKVWQDNRYFSIDAVILKRQKNIHPLEKNRLLEIDQIIDNNLKAMSEY